MLGAPFWQFSEWSNFFNISSLLEPLFVENNCIVLLRYDRILKSCKNGQFAEAMVRESGLF